MAEETKVGEEGDHWMQTKWRPAMGWMYMTVCTCDFVVFPVLWSLLQAMTHGSVSSQWQPIAMPSCSGRGKSWVHSTWPD